MENQEKPEYKNGCIYPLSKLIRCKVEYERINPDYKYRQPIKFLGFNFMQEGLYYYSKWDSSHCILITENEIEAHLIKNNSVLKGSLSFTKLKAALKDKDFYPVKHKAKITLSFENDFTQTQCFSSNEACQNWVSDFKTQLKERQSIIDYA